MSACCKGYVYGGEHDAACAYNPKNIIDRRPETKADAAKKAFSPEEMKLFAKELASLKADYFKKIATEQSPPPISTGRT